MDDLRSDEEWVAAVHAELLEDLEQATEEAKDALDRVRASDTLLRHLSLYASCAAERDRARARLDAFVRALATYRPRTLRHSPTHGWARLGGGFRHRREPQRAAELLLAYRCVRETLAARQPPSTELQWLVGRLRQRLALEPAVDLDAVLRSEDVQNALQGKVMGQWGGPHAATLEALRVAVDGHMSTRQMERLMDDADLGHLRG